MKLAEGVNLHLIKNHHYKTNHLTVRFSGDYRQKTVAKRALVAQMLATASQSYPSSLSLRKKLASLYGSQLETTVSTRGKVHIVDLDVTFVKDCFTFNQESLLEQIVNLVKELLFSPLVSIAQYRNDVFELEKQNFKRYLASDYDDSFYSSQLALQSLYYTDQDLAVDKYGTVDLVDKETAYSAYQELRRMLNQDRVDIFLVGDFDEYRMVQLFTKWAFEDRQKDLVFEYYQEQTNLVREFTERRPRQQSVLQLAYGFPISPGRERTIALVLLGMLGTYSHSLLFTEVREKAGLAYTIGCQANLYTGLLNLYAGVDKDNRELVLRLITKQLLTLKSGRFSSQFIEETKAAVKSNRLLLEDQVKYQIEKKYSNTFLKTQLSLEEFLEEVDSICKEELVELAQRIRLQTLYFVEGQ